jgi:hypothetical protein
MMPRTMRRMDRPSMEVPSASSAAE